MKLKKALAAAGVALALPIVLGVLVVNWRVAATVDRWIEQARPFAVINRGSSFVRLNGEIGVERIEVAGVAGQFGTLRAERVTLNTPGLGWLLRTALLGQRGFPQRFGVSVDGLDASLLELDGSEPAVIGAASGALFDHAGCQEDPFTDGDLVALGLPRQAPRLFVRYDFGVDDLMRLETGVERAGSAAFNLQLRLRVPGGAGGNLGALAGAAFENMALEFIDEGFAAARNAACTTRNRLDADAFHAANLAMAQRMLRAAGMVPSDAFWQAYGTFARSGGRLLVNGMPSRPIAVASLRRGAPLGAVIRWQVGHDSTVPRQMDVAMVVPVPMREVPRTLAQQIEAEDAVRRAAAAPPRPAETAAPRVAGGTPATPVATDTPKTPLATGAPAAPIAAQGDDWVGIPYADLRGREGAVLRVATAHGTQRTGRLTRWNTIGMDLALDASEGGITLSMSPRDVKSIEILVPGWSGGSLPGN